MRQKTRLEATCSRNWEKGVAFSSADVTWCAKESVMNQLKLSSKKQLSKAKVILSGFITDLAKKQDLKEAHILSEGTKKNIGVVELMVRSASFLVISLGLNVTPVATNQCELEWSTSTSTAAAPARALFEGHCGSGCCCGLQREHRRQVLRGNSDECLCGDCWGSGHRCWF